MPLQYTWRASKLFIFFIKVRAVDIVTLGTDFLQKKKNTKLWLGGDSPTATATKTSLKKWIRATSNCIAPILTCSNVGKCLWSWILRHCIKVQENKKKVVVLCSRPRQNVNLGTFTLYSCSDGKEMYKKSVMHVQSCCFANLNQLLFCRSCCCRRRRCLLER